MICSTETILISCRFEKRFKSGSRAIGPSRFITSQITAPGCKSASSHRSTDASVCPARTSTPPSRARSGNMCPGRAKSSGRVFGSISTCTVRARSGAEIPVVTPVRASTLTVKAVPSGAVFCPWSTIKRSPSRSSRSPLIAMQISPRPCVAMKLIVSDVTNCAGSARSPSFSRSSSSVMISGRPCANS